MESINKLLLYRLYRLEKTRATVGMSIEVYSFVQTHTFHTHVCAYVHALVRSNVRIFLTKLLLLLLLLLLRLYE